MEVFKKPVDQLSQDPANARKHGPRNVEAIIASLRRFGQQKPIVVDSSGVVRAGNGTLEAARQLGWETVDCVQTPLQGSEATAYAIADNRTAELAEWDADILAATLEGLRFEDADLAAAAGWNEAELTKALAGRTGEIVEDEVPEPPADPITKPGDLWLLGQHRLLCGDSTNGGDVRRLVNGLEVDLCVTSPPYNCDIAYRTHKDRMEATKYLDFIGGVIRNAVGVLGGGRFVAWNVGVTPKSLHFDHARLLEESGLDFWRQIVWAKAGVAFPIWQYTTAARKYHPNYTHEVIYLFSKGMPLAGESADVDDQYSRDVWQVHQSAATRDLAGVSNGRKPRNDKHGGSKAAAHPAAYPIGIPAGCIKHLTARAETVFDPFCGSGTTLIAAEQLGRRCYGLEIDPAYCDVIVQRWEKLTGNKAERGSA